MARVAIATCLLVFITAWSTMYGQHCRNSRCVVPYTRCATNKGSNDYCLDGCKEGIWGHRCYNPCPSNCSSCDQDSTNGGYPCTSCIVGKYGSTYCYYNCPVICAACTLASNNVGYPCTKCKDNTKYGDYCDTPCSVRCDDGTCNIDGSCTCIVGYSGDFCEIVDCPSNCQTCNSPSNCQTCVVGYYNGYKYENTRRENTNVCEHPCQQNCKICTKYDSCTSCDEGFYGSYCQYDCSAGCDGGTCNIDGSCSCKEGYSGNTCDAIDCPNNCQACTSPSECQTCVGGFYNGYKYENTRRENTNVCEHLCQQNCKICTKYYSCTSCDEGFYGSYCQYDCSAGCDGGTCNIDGSCNCKAGYSGNTCDAIDCPNNCQACTSPSECQTCDDGYYNGNNYGEYNVCKHACRTRTTPHCKSCTGYSSCTTCDDGYYGQHCGTPCSSGCFYGTCNIDGICTCISGYSGNKCDTINCPNNCKTCTSPSQCQTCADGYYNWMSNGEYTSVCKHTCRTSTAPHCKSCTDDSSCNQCDDGYYGQHCETPCSYGCFYGTCNIDGSCNCKAGYSGNKCDIINCPNNCATCNSPTSCQTCVDGYYNGNNKYKEYTSVCKHACRTSTAPHCKSCTDYSSCNQCDDGYYGEYCGTPCSSGCQTGTCKKESGTCNCKSGFRGDKCKQCIAGRYSDDCILNCLSHDCTNNVCIRDSGRCSSCNTGYYGNDLCDQSCSTSCKDSKCEFTLGTCDCVTGYSGDKCCLNNDNCETCSSNTQCSVCKTGYSGDKCCLNNNNCETCSSNTQCLNCKSGYSGDKCCVNNDRCITCSSPSACFQCKPGYSGDKCCLPNAFCETCSSLTECSKCIDGRHGIMCAETCPDNCADIACRNDGFCNSCKAGFYGKQCENECLKNCKICNPNGKCKECINGYYGNSCNKCLDNCDRCNSKTTCRSCIDGYFGKKCDRCRPNCVSCSSLNDCDICTVGYYGHACQLECSNCKEGTKCHKLNGYCKEGCKDGKYGSLCSFDCESKCTACKWNSFHKCTLCANGRYGKTSWDENYNCDKYCSSNCLNKTCNGSTGYCDKCIEGFTGDMCDCPVNCLCTKTGKCDTCVGYFANIDNNCSDCALNRYGVSCQIECNSHCLDNDQNTKCHGTNGTCITGCTHGFYGVECELPCDQKCVNETCSRVDGICSYGCKDGFTDYGAKCVIAKTSVDTDDGASSGADIGGYVVGVIAVLTIVAGVLVFLFLKRRRANNAKNASPDTHDVRQNNPNTLSGSVLIFDNTTESVNVHAPEADININSIEQPVADPNFNKSPVKPKPKAEYLRKSIKPEDLPKSVQSQDMRMSTRYMASNQNIELDIDSVNNDIGTVIPTTTTTKGNYGYYNLAGIKRGIPVTKLADYVAKRNNDNFDQEFKEFDNGLVRPYLDSQKPNNRARNRYQHIYPYDEHRVHLQGSTTDYINASYIDGYQHPKEYIACLGPTEKATEDFEIVWMMIWEQKVEKIVMVTNLFENAAMKCEQYWPDVTTSLTYGDVTVTCHSEDEYADYTLRSLTVSKDSENRSLHHIHYTAWPDKGVPDNVTSIIEFRQRVNSITTKLGGPVIVHCSAGIGRTGTYIALDSLTKEGQDTQSVNTYGFVKRMREQRVNMVQTSEQYQYLHSAVVHSLTFDCAAVTAEQFNQHFKNMNDKTMETKFKQLQLTIEQRSDEEVKAFAVNNKHKGLNRSGADIPGDYRRPKLHLNKDTDSCDYINAVFVNSFKTTNRFIVAMSPLPGTVLDFLTLLYQENCSCIVSLEAPESLNDKNVGTYYPAANQVLNHDVFKVTCAKVVTSDNYVMSTLTITYNKQAESTSKTFTHFQFTKWSRGGHVPSDPAIFLQMILDVETKANATADNGPILIHCLNGAARSGLYCAVSILREKMEIEHEVSVVNTVRYIKARRSSAIPNKDQYAFCHQAVVAYLDTFDKDIYSNFSLKL